MIHTNRARPVLAEMLAANVTPCAPGVTRGRPPRPCSLPQGARAALPHGPPSPERWRRASSSAS